MPANGSDHAASAHAGSSSLPSIAGGLAARWQTYPFGCGAGGRSGAAARRVIAASTPVTVTDLVMQTLLRWQHADPACQGFEQAAQLLGKGIKSITFLAIPRHRRQNGSR